MRVALDQLSTIRKNHPESKIVYGGGAFDILHSGHIAFLHSLASRGDIVVVGVASDKKVAHKKGRDRPVQRQHTRAMIIDDCKCVDYTVIVPMDTPVEPSTARILRLLKPDQFVTRDVSNWKKYAPYAEALGVEIYYDRSTKHDSTSRIIKRILAGAEANAPAA